MKSMNKLFAAFVVALLGMLYTVSAVAAGYNSAGVPSYDGMWWNASQSGQGATVAHQNGKVVVTFFGNHSPQQNQQGPTMFFQIAGDLQKDGQGRDTLPTTDAYMTLGPQPMGFDTTKVSIIRVGTASITFTGVYDAVMTYDYQDQSGGPEQKGTINLTQYQFGCDAPAKWNNTFCTIPQGTKIVGANQLPVGCNKQAQATCWPAALKNVVKLSPTKAKMTGYSDRPVMFAFYRNNDSAFGTVGLWQVKAIYADDGSPIGTDTIDGGNADEVDWFVTNDQGAIYHDKPQNLCWQIAWDARQQGWSANGGANGYPVACPF